MKTTANDPIGELQGVLAEPWPGHGARITFLGPFLRALFKGRSVNLAEWATGFGGPALVSSHYQRLQRFCGGFTLDQESLARWWVRLVPVGDGPWRLTLDRTPGRFGPIDIHFRVLGRAYGGIAVPVLWNVLDPAGNSNTSERIALMERFVAVFGVERVGVLRADREFGGEAGFRGLPTQRIPFHHPIKRDPLLPHPGNRMRRVDTGVRHLKPAPVDLIPARRPVWGCFVPRSVLRLDDGERRVVAPSGASPPEAIDASADRGPVETLFGCLKTRGFRFAHTPLKEAYRLSKMMGLLALAFAWTHRPGEHLHDPEGPIPLKKLFNDLSHPFFATASTSSPPWSSTCRTARLTSSVC